MRISPEAKQYAAAAPTAAPAEAFQAGMEHERRRQREIAKLAARSIAPAKAAAETDVVA